MIKNRFRFQIKQKSIAKKSGRTMRVSKLALIKQYNYDDIYKT